MARKRTDSKKLQDLDLKYAEILENALTITNPYAKYREDPVLFAKEVLGIELWSAQAAAARAVVKYRRVLIKSANGVGKTLLVAVLAVWFYLCWREGECIITGPRAEQLDDTTFKEIRTFLESVCGRSSGLYPRQSRAETSPKHLIKTTTAKDANAFQGTHPINCMLIFEEATGVDAEFFEAGRRILVGGNQFWICIFNPTDSSSQVYNEEQSGQWYCMTISALDHPNIKAELAGKKAPIPSAVRLEGLISNMSQWGDWIAPEQVEQTDIKFEQPGQPTKFWRPSPLGYACILGLYPPASSFSIFSQRDLERAETFKSEFVTFMEELAKDAAGDKGRGDPNRFGYDLAIKIGVDVARFGEDRTCITVVIGKYILHHESRAGADTKETAERIKALAREWGNRLGIVPEHICVLIDDTGVGGGVVDQRGNYNFVGVNSSSSAIQDGKFPNKRSEILFNLADLLREGKVRFGVGVDSYQAAEIRRQALTINYSIDSRGRRVAESKDKVRERVRRSPDDLDSIGLAFYPLGGYVQHETVTPEKKPLIRDTRSLFKDKRKELYR